MHLEVRKLGDGRVEELHIAAQAAADGDIASQARRLFAAVHGEAATGGARLCHERVFVPAGHLEVFRQARQAALGHDTRTIPCTWLSAGPTAPPGIQGYAIKGLAEPTPLVDDVGSPAGLLWTDGTYRWAVIGGLYAPGCEDQQLPARRAFESAERLLRQANMALADVARTWFFLDDILAWYDPFNAARNRLFQERGLLTVGDFNSAVPASTGIGLSPADGSRLALDVFAVSGPDGCICRKPAAGRQRSPYEYGSAFARAAAVPTPAGRAVFVSGTAAIDPQGNSCFIGDAAAQIRMTIDNVLAVLDDMRAPAQSVVAAIAYCKSPAVAAEFNGRFRAAQPWPWVVAVGDVCRDDLLFEVEVTACQAGSPGEA